MKQRKWGSNSGHFRLTKGARIFLPWWIWLRLESPLSESAHQGAPRGSVNMFQPMFFSSAPLLRSHGHHLTTLLCIQNFWKMNFLSFILCKFLLFCNILCGCVMLAHMRVPISSCQILEKPLSENLIIVTIKSPKPISIPLKISPKAIGPKTVNKFPFTMDHYSLLVQCIIILFQGGISTAKTNVCICVS